MAFAQACLLNSTMPTGGVMVFNEAKKSRKNFPAWIKNWGAY
jgi:hypothetical protein